MDEFVTKILPVVQRYTRMRLRDEELASIALVLAWYYWSRATNRGLPASVWARVGVRHALAGRDLPGVQASHTHDAMEHPDTWLGSDMGLLMDHRPGPEHQAEVNERLGRFWAALTARERRIALALMNGSAARDVACEEGLSPGRITQMRQRMLERWQAA